MTALIAAVTKNLYEVAEILIHKGAHVNASSVRKHAWLYRNDAKNMISVLNCYLVSHQWSCTW